MVSQMIKHNCLHPNGAIFVIKYAQNCFFLLATQNVKLTRFDVKWAISRKRGYSENVRKYYTLGVFL